MKGQHTYELDEFIDMIFTAAPAKPHTYDFSADLGMSIMDSNTIALRRLFEMLLTIFHKGCLLLFDTTNSGRIDVSKMESAHIGLLKEYFWSFGLDIDITPQNRMIEKSFIVNGTDSIEQFAFYLKTAASSVILIQFKLLQNIV